MQSVSMATNSFILLLMLSISCLCSTRDVYIRPPESDYCPGTLCCNITTFGKMADSFSNSSGLVVHFLEGTHFLDLQELVVFTNLTDALFEGDGRMEQGFHETVWQSTVVIKCTEHSSTGIAFVNSSNIIFRYITIYLNMLIVMVVSGSLMLATVSSLIMFQYRMGQAMVLLPVRSMREGYAFVSVYVRTYVYVCVCVVKKHACFRLTA